MFEKRHDALLSLPRFAGRMFLFVLSAAVVVGAALLVGVGGYHWIAGFSVVDSILNASMILTGMGPVGQLATTQAKLFASAYAIFSGLVFITAMSILLTPVVHRFLHAFHLEEADDEGEGPGPDT